jgi:hypothetical protein
VTRISENPAVSNSAYAIRTAERLDWLKCVQFDIGNCLHVAAVLMFQVVEKDTVAFGHRLKTGEALLSDDAIADKTGLRERQVRNVRKLMKEAGWLDWRRTGDANVYRLRSERVPAVLAASGQSSTLTPGLALTPGSRL